MFEKIIVASFFVVLIILTLVLLCNVGIPAGGNDDGTEGIGREATTIESNFIETQEVDEVITYEIQEETEYYKIAPNDELIAETIKLETMPEITEAEPEVYVYTPYTPENYSYPGVDKYTTYYGTLSEELLNYTKSIADSFGLPYELLVAVMYVESGFNPYLISSTWDYGIMQISYIVHPRLYSELEITNFLDPYDNIMAGAYLLAEKINAYSDYNMALMAYNLGDGGAGELWNQGIYSSYYSRKVLSMYEFYRNGD